MVALVAPYAAVALRTNRDRSIGPAVGMLSGQGAERREPAQRPARDSATQDDATEHVRTCQAKPLATAAAPASADGSRGLRSPGPVSFAPEEKLPGRAGADVPTQTSPGNSPHMKPTRRSSRSDARDVVKPSHRSRISERMLSRTQPVDSAPALPAWLPGTRPERAGIAPPLD